MTRQGDRTWINALAASSCIAIGACSSLPEQIDTLEQARNLVREVESSPLANAAAATELESARSAIQSADAAYENDEPLEIVEHRAYVAYRHAQIAEQQVEEAQAQRTLQQGEAERNRVLLEAREREARVAAQNAQEARNLAEQRGLAVVAQSTATEAAQQRSRELEQRIAELEAEDTERGLVVTLSDVLFATGEATLNPGANRTLEQIAAFMREYPERRLRIEGHTDARGDEEFNLELSRERARAVADALAGLQIDPQRIETIGLGESFPVASNESPAGMQQNRRVEILFSDEGGEFPAGSDRRASR
jgi:outer membrane protein OmpA-like peptidoglycan-associated protein